MLRERVAEGYNHRIIAFLRYVCVFKNSLPFGYLSLGFGFSFWVSFFSLSDHNILAKLSVQTF